MRISRTPLRLSFTGGATDIFNYYSKYGGEVVSCAINKYIYITYNKRDDNKIVISYAKIEQVNTVEEIQHGIVRECLKLAEVDKGIEIHIIADISTIGTGLGGSSAITVGLLKVLYPDKKQSEIAEMACDIEINKLGKCIGKQDQYACAVGGLNHLIFEKNGKVKINPIIYNKILKDKMFLFNSSNSRIEAESILQEQNNKFGQNERYLHQIRQLCSPFIDALKKENETKLAEIINDYWSIKRNLCGFVCNKNINTIINTYRTQRCGVKLCGAGQSGFIFIYNAENKEGLFPIDIDNTGTTIICNS